MPSEVPVSHSLCLKSDIFMFRKKKAKTEGSRGRLGRVSCRHYKQQQQQQHDLQARMQEGHSKSTYTLEGEGSTQKTFENVQGQTLKLLRLIIAANV